MKQSYPFKTSGRQPSETARRLAMEERSRTIISDGTVIKFMEDNSVQVCFETISASNYAVTRQQTNEKQTSDILAPVTMTGLLFYKNRYYILMERSAD